MSTIQWRPEVNALTTPQSWRPRHIPRAILGNNDLAAKIAQRNPPYTEGMYRGFLQEMIEVLREELINRNQWTLEGLLTCHLSLTGRMDAPDDPLPPQEDCLQVKIYASKRLAQGGAAGAAASVEEAAADQQGGRHGAEAERRAASCWQRSAL